MEGFTPGPWIKAEAGDGYRITAASRENKIEIATVETGFNGPIEVEQQANANLITAAPEMLEALELCVEFCFFRKFPKDDMVYSKISEVMFKATGKYPRF